MLQVLDHQPWNKSLKLKELVHQSNEFFKAHFKTLMNIFNWILDSKEKVTSLYDVPGIREDEKPEEILIAIMI